MRMAIHEAVYKSDGVVFRCTLSSSAADRWLERCHHLIIEYGYLLDATTPHILLISVA
jgi:hypothetical protein